jgi:hypothetical protein
MLTVSKREPARAFLVWCRHLQRGIIFGVGISFISFLFIFIEGAGYCRSFSFTASPAARRYSTPYNQKPKKSNNLLTTAKTFLYASFPASAGYGRQYKVSLAE